MTATETQTPGSVDLTANGTKRRGRPPGSRNKTASKTTSTKATTRQAKPKVTTSTATGANQPKIHAVLIEDSGFSVLHEDGTSMVFEVPVYDRRKTK